VESPPSSTLSSEVGRRSQQVGTRATLVLVGVLFAALTAEGALRLAGFEFHPYPVVQFGYPDPVTLQRQYERDPDLFWVTRDYRDRLRRARRDHPAIVFLGDSCTEFGRYPEFAVTRLALRRPDAATGVALGASGWSSHQGLQQLRRDILPLRPSVVTLYYGWNDHWLALGPPDDEVVRSRAFSWASERFRVVQLFEKVRLAAEHRAEDPPRVPLARYRANLEEMVRLAHQARAEAVLITAPSNHVAGKEPQYLLRRHLKQLDALIPLHRAYVEATREAARTSGATLCDAAARFDELPAPHDRYFHSDGIHLTDDGDQILAELVSTCIEHALSRRDDVATRR
jgi:lysophospholipase L1-like esterase